MTPGHRPAPPRPARRGRILPPDPLIRHSLPFHSERARPAPPRPAAPSVSRSEASLNIRSTGRYGPDREIYEVRRGGAGGALSKEMAELCGARLPPLSLSLSSPLSLSLSMLTRTREY